MPENPAADPGQRFCQRVALRATAKPIGGYDSIFEATRHMARLKDEVYTPIAEHKAIYDEIYAEYVRLHDYFGRGQNDAMKRLKALKSRVQAGL
jgi:L-ribulokinase